MSEIDFSQMGFCCMAEKEPGRMIIIPESALPLMIVMLLNTCAEPKICSMDELRARVKNLADETMGFVDTMEKTRQFFAQLGAEQEAKTNADSL